MNKIGNHVVGMQESEDFQFGWLSAERGEPKPIWACHNIEEMDRLQAQQFGWHSFHTETGSYGSPEGVTRNGKRHWIPNSSTRWTDYLSAEKALDLIEGANHARELGFPLNLSLTIHFERGNLNPIYTPQMSIGYFLKAANQWLALRGIPATFIWVREHVIGTGRHVHILLHCPLEYQAEFKKRAKQKWVLLAGMDKADRDTLHFERIGPRGYAEGQASTRDRQKYLNQLKGSLKYHLKGIDPDQALPRVTGDNRPIAELLGIEPEGNQPIYGRRASQSQNISRGARERYAAGKQQSEATTASQ